MPRRRVAWVVSGRRSAVSWRRSTVAGGRVVAATRGRPVGLTGRVVAATRGRPIGLTGRVVAATRGRPIGLTGRRSTVAGRRVVSRLRRATGRRRALARIRIVAVAPRRGIPGVAPRRRPRSVPVPGRIVVGGLPGGRACGRGTVSRQRVPVHIDPAVAVPVIGRGVVIPGVIVVRVPAAEAAVRTVRGRVEVGVPDHRRPRVRVVVVAVRVIAVVGREIVDVCALDQTPGIALGRDRVGAGVAVLRRFVTVGVLARVLVNDAPCGADHRCDGRGQEYGTHGTGPP